MNDLQTHPGSPESPANLPAPKGWWGRAVAFLKRDVKSFLPGARDAGVSSEPAGVPAAPISVEMPVESLVDFTRLADLAFRREILDWRDDFQAAATISIARSHEAFIEQMDAELANTSLFRKVIARPSDEVLQDSFARIVRRPLIKILRKQEAQLDEIARKWGLLGKADLAFDLRRLNSECEGLHDIGFRPAHKDLISSRIQALLLEPAGIAEDFRNQGLGLSEKLLEARTS